MQAKIYEYLKGTKKAPEVIIFENSKAANIAKGACEHLGYECFVLPDFLAVSGDDLRAFCAELFKISEVLSKFYNSENSKKLILSPLSTILHKLPNKEHLKQIELKVGQDLNLSELKNSLIRFGYNLVDIIEDKAEASFHGEVIDIFDVASQNPIRIVLDFDKIESIKFFDINTQKSENCELKSVLITPFLAGLSQDDFEKISEKIAGIKTDSIENSINAFGLWYIDDLVDFTKEFDCILESKKILNELEELNFIKFSSFDEISEPKIYRDIDTAVINESFFNYHSGRKITLFSSNESQVRALGLESAKNITFINSNIILNIISDDEIIVSLNKSSAQSRAKKASIIIDELKIGDLVVHETHGIGKFSGLEQARALGVMQEFVVLTYLGGDRLLIPTSNLACIDRYIASSGSIASLDKLGKGSFAKIKEKVKEKLFVIANAIIAMAAKRELIEALKFDNYEGYENFIKNAGFAYTDDQETAVNEIKADLASTKVMDRLLSGDVGFGKTEVAMNAIYLCVKAGYCALFFVPTTLLCMQHYKTLKERFTPFGLKVFRLDRFSSTAQKNEAKKALENGENVVVIGTHALLNLKAKNLGLIVIDEEHKFGVKQKEKLKEISANSHILSMSATPIPRSLNMALSSVKSYSSLTTPPLDRLSVRTFAKKWDANVIKEAIMRELRRKGQIFYVHNLIADLERIKREILAIVPTLKILVLHGKIDAKTSEDEIMNFADGKYDMLLCTSIVESGIHLPNANTIFVDNANKFGIADLHQLRGRVGRGKTQGYCYFLVDEDAVLSADATKRLLALESNSFLGSGAILARHDLEIRGGGNLLGEAQSGHIETIGYSLYLKMLESEINRSLALKNDNEQKDFNTEIRININAFINSELISEDRLRLELYRRLSLCTKTEQVYEIGAEIEDRFGKLDIYTKQFLDLIVIKIMAKNAGIKGIDSYLQNISFTKINGEKIQIKAKSKDEDDIISAIFEHLKRS